MIMNNTRYLKAACILICAACLSTGAIAAPAAVSGASERNTSLAVQINIPEGFNYTLSDIRHACFFSERDATAGEGALLFDGGENSFVDFSLLSPRRAGLSLLGDEMSVVSRQETLLKSGVRFRYRFYERGVSVARAEAGLDYGEPVAYILDAEQYTNMMDHIWELAESWPRSIEWLCEIRPSRTDTITVRAASGESNTYAKSGGTAAFWAALDSLADVMVTAGPSRHSIYADLANPTIRVDLSYLGVVRYTIFANDSSILITSKLTDKPYALCYPLAGGSISVIESLAGKTLQDAH